MIEKTLDIPENVNIEIKGKRMKVSGPKGELEKEFKYFWDIKIENKDGKIVVSSESDRRKCKAMGGTIIAHIQNMIKGVTEGYTYKMRIVYSHFPFNLKVEGDKVLIHNFLSEKLPRTARIIGDTKIDIQGQDVTLTSIDKDDVAQTAANIETATKIRKKDRRVFMDGCFITSKG